MLAANEVTRVEWLVVLALVVVPLLVGLVATEISARRQRRRLGPRGEPLDFTQVRRPW